MADMEKAIRILEGNYKSFVLRHNGELLTVNELIALLKAQEPVKRKPYDSFDYLCGSCNRVISRRYDYCPWCGRAVKRDA